MGDSQLQFGSDNAETQLPISDSQIENTDCFQKILQKDDEETAARNVSKVGFENLYGGFVLIDLQSFIL